MEAAKARARADNAMAGLGDLERDLHYQQLREALGAAGGELLEGLGKTWRDEEYQKALVMIGVSTALGIMGALIRRAV